MNIPRMDSLSRIHGPVTLPDYDPAAHGVGILHLGIGAFHRSHQAVATDDAIARSGGNWRITGVSLRSRQVADALGPQNGLYTLIERGGSGSRARVIGAIKEVIAADPKRVMAAMSDPAIRIVTLTVTEKGYGINRTTRTADPNHPAVASDLAHPDRPSGVLGLICASLAARRAAGIAPFTILSCDNLPENGALLRDGVLDFARRTNTDLADWIAQNVAFPSSMVDRITPAATSETLAEAVRQTGCCDMAAIETEPFMQWVIEDHFPQGRPEWEASGVIFVRDVVPYEQMKLTMLNGSHSMLAYAGFLSDHLYVRDVMSDDALALLVRRHLRAAASCLPELKGFAKSDYAADLEKRFRNPAIAHETRQIAMDGTQKLPQRIFQPALKTLSAGQDPRPFAFATAAWMRYALGVTDKGETYDLHDPREVEIHSALAGTGRDAQAISSVLHQIPELFPRRLIEDTTWRNIIEPILALMLAEGMPAAIRQEAGR